MAFAAATLLPGIDQNQLHAHHPAVGAGTLRDERLAGGHSVVLLGPAAARPVVAAVVALAERRIRDLAGAVVALVEHALSGPRRSHVARRVRPRQLGGKAGAGLCLSALLPRPGGRRAALSVMAQMAE